MTNDNEPSMKKKDVDAAMDGMRKDLIEGFQAAQEVRAIVGDVKPGTPARDCYRLALDEMKVDHKDIKEIASLRALVKLASDKSNTLAAPVAMDQASLTKKFPNANRFGRG